MQDNGTLQLKFDFVERLRSEAIRINTQVPQSEKPYIPKTPESTSTGIGEGKITKFKQVPKN